MPFFLLYRPGVPGEKAPEGSKELYSLRLFVVLAAALLTLSACGGGGGSSAPAGSGRVFSLGSLKGAETGLLFSSTLAGEDSSGRSCVGSIALDAGSPAEVQGVLATPVTAALSANCGRPDAFSETIAAGDSLMTSVTYFFGIQDYITAPDLVLKESIPGTRLNDWTTMLDTLLAEHPNADSLIMALGTNDLTRDRTAAEMIADAKTIVTGVVAGNRDILLIDILQHADDAGRSWTPPRQAVLEEYNTAMKSWISGVDGAYWLDVYASIADPDRPAGIYKRPEFNALAAPGLFDFRHLSAAGAQFIGRAIDARIASVRSNQAEQNTVTTLTRRYVDPDGVLITQTDDAPGSTCTPVTPDGFPAAVSVGESGSLATLLCDDNTTIETIWVAEDAGNDEMNFVIRRVTRDALNTLTESSEYVYSIATNGEITGFSKASTQEPGGYTLSLASN